MTLPPREDAEAIQKKINDVQVLIEGLDEIYDKILLYEKSTSNSLGEQVLQAERVNQFCTLQRARK